MFMPFGMGRMNNTRLVAAMVLAIGLVSLFMLPVILRLRQAAEKDPAVRLWLRFRRKLAKAGIETHSSSAPMELAEAVGSEIGEGSQEIYRIANLYQRLRYAPGAPGFEDLARAVRAFRPARQPR